MPAARSTFARRKLDGHAQAFEDADHRLADFREELIDVAGNGHRYRFARPVGRIVLAWCGLVASGCGQSFTGSRFWGTRQGKTLVIPARGTVVQIRAWK